VQLPDPVRRSIESRAEAAGFAPLARAAQLLSDAYRDHRPHDLAQIPAEHRTAAYLVTRMPATYAAAFQVMAEVRRRLGEPLPASVLDVGAGTGAASLAARAWFPDAALTMLERDADFARAAEEWLPDAARLGGDLGRIKELPPHDLVIAAYSMGEMEPGLLWRLWEAARVALVLIEPGTPRGFAAIAAMRTGLLQRGAAMLAPCPGSGPCPIQSPDWCHFAARVERSSLHRRLKAAGLNYEDEKFSYLAVARHLVELPAARILRRPEHHPGLIRIAQCTPSGIESRNVTRRDPSAFRQARRAAWGDTGFSL
jgi:ribosomal protein RSM22 (predicted rRNA methylase)